MIAIFVDSPKLALQTGLNISSHGMFWSKWIFSFGRCRVDGCFNCGVRTGNPPETWFREATKSARNWGTYFFWLEGV